MTKQEFLNNLISFSNKELNTPVLGVSRSIMAIASLATLLVNDISVLFPILDGLSNSSQPNYEIFLKNFSIYSLVEYQYGKWISIFILLTVFSGWKPKYTCFFHWWVCFSLFTSSPSIDGGDQLLAVLTLFLIPICVTDKRNFHWSPSADEKQKNINFSSVRFIRNSFFVVIRLQISYLYFQAATDKFKVPEWRDGTVLYYWFNHPYFGLNNNLNWLNDVLFYNYVSSSILTWSVLILELLLFMALLSDKRYRIPLFYCGVAFHFFTWIVHGLFTFFLTMTTALILYLVPLEKEINFSFKRIFSRYGLSKTFKSLL